jgi:hypothetical protein
MKEADLADSTHAPSRVQPTNSNTGASCVVPSASLCGICRGGQHGKSVQEEQPAHNTLCTCCSTASASQPHLPTRYTKHKLKHSKPTFNTVTRSYSFVAVFCKSCAGQGTNRSRATHGCSAHPRTLQIVM